MIDYSSDEDEVFFGPVTEKEKKKISGFYDFEKTILLDSALPQNEESQQDSFHESNSSAPEEELVSSFHRCNDGLDSSSDKKCEITTQFYTKKAKDFDVEESEENGLLQRSKNFDEDFVTLEVSASSHADVLHELEHLTISSSIPETETFLSCPEMSSNLTDFKSFSNTENSSYQEPTFLHESEKQTSPVNHGIILESHESACLHDFQNNLSQTNDNFTAEDECQSIEALFQPEQSCEFMSAQDFSIPIMNEDDSMFTNVGVSLCSDNFQDFSQLEISSHDLDTSEYFDTSVDNVEENGNKVTHPKKNCMEIRNFCPNMSDSSKFDSTLKPIDRYDRFEECICIGVKAEADKIDDKSSLGYIESNVELDNKLIKNIKLENNFQNSSEGLDSIAMRNSLRERRSNISSPGFKSEPNCSDILNKNLENKIDMLSESEKIPEISSSESENVSNSLHGTSCCIEPDDGYLAELSGFDSLEGEESTQPKSLLLDNSQNSEKSVHYTNYLAGANMETREQQSLVAAPIDQVELIGNSNFIDYSSTESENYAPVSDFFSKNFPIRGSDKNLLSSAEKENKKNTPLKLAHLDEPTSPVRSVASPIVKRSSTNKKRFTTTFLNNNEATDISKQLFLDEESTHSSIEVLSDSFLTRNDLENCLTLKANVQVKPDINTVASPNLKDKKLQSPSISTVNMNKPTISEKTKQSPVVSAKSNINKSPQPMQVLRPWISKSSQPTRIISRLPVLSSASKISKLNPTGTMSNSCSKIGQPAPKTAVKPIVKELFQKTRQMKENSPTNIKCTPSAFLVPKSNNVALKFAKKLKTPNKYSNITSPVSKYIQDPTVSPLIQTIKPQSRITSLSNSKIGKPSVDIFVNDKKFPSISPAKYCFKTEEKNVHDGATIQKPILKAQNGSYPTITKHIGPRHVINKTKYLENEESSFESSRLSQCISEMDATVVQEVSLVQSLTIQKMK